MLLFYYGVIIILIGHYIIETGCCFNKDESLVTDLEVVDLVGFICLFLLFILEIEGGP